MSCEESNLKTDEKAFKEYRDPKSRRSKSYKVYNIMKSDAHFVCMKRTKKASYAKYRSKLKSVPYCDLPIAPRVQRKVPGYDNSLSYNIKFHNREITDIQEEVIHYRHHSKSHSSSKDKRKYKDKVASLTKVVKRLQQMCLAKPEVVPNKLPEEVMLLFSGIKLK